MIIDRNLPQKIETKLGGEYNVESVVNDDGTQTLNITSAEKVFSNKSGQIIDGTIEVLSAEDLKDTTHIRDNLFSGCTNLKSVTIPENIETIGISVFTNCPNITEIHCDSDNVLIADTARIFENSGSNKGINLTFGDNVTNIPNNLCNAVYNGQGINIKHVVIPDNIVTIGDRAFKDNLCLSLVTIGENVTSIEEYAFHYCHKLIEVCNLSTLDIKNSNTNHGYIGWYAKNIYTPNAGHSKLVTDGEYVFYEDTNINYIVEYNGLDTVLILPNKTYNYEIYKYAFYKTNIQSLVLSDSVTAIGSYACEGCKSLTNLIISNNVVTIGEKAFYGCAITGKLIIPNSVNTIAQYAFRDCAKLTELILGTGITNIANYVFYNTGIKEITIKAITPPAIQSSTFPSASSITAIYIPTGTLAVYNAATNWTKYADKFVEIDMEVEA